MIGQLISTPVDQLNEELVYGLIQCPKWYPINYVEGGFFDRCLKNFKEHAKESNLTDNDYYDWVRIPTPSNIHTIWLARPGKTVERKLKTIYTQDGYPKRLETWVNVVRLDLFFYKSMAQPGVQGFTFGDRTHVLKPLKVLNHKWTKPGDWHDTWKCSKCGLTGRSHEKAEAALIPDKLLTCDEVCVADILL